MLKSNSCKGVATVWVICLAALLVVASAGRALAAESKDTAYVEILVGSLEAFIVHGDIDFGTVTGFGYTQTETGDITAARNYQDWKVSIRATAASWTGSNGGRADKPCSHLEYQGGDVGSWTQLSTSTATVKTGIRGASTWEMSYRLLIVGADTSGDYQIDVEYTLTDS